MADFLECPICSDTFTQVVETPCCHRCYCRDCLRMWMLKNTTCPSCRSAIESIDQCVPNIPLQRVVNEIPAQCPFENCTDKITRGILEEHTKTCQYGPLICEYGKENCTGLLKKDKKNHEIECQYRPVKCEKCDTQVLMNDLDAHLTSVCPMSEISCTNEECKELVIRSKLEEHLAKHCLFQVAECDYTKYGCDAKMIRAKLVDHMQNEALTHLKMVTAVCEKLQSDNEKLTQKVNQSDLKLQALTYGIQELSVLKPSLPYSPLHLMPVLLPSAMRDQFYKDIVSISEDKVTVGTKNARNFSSAFFQKMPPVEPVIIPANKLIPDLTKFENSPYYFEIKILKLASDSQIYVGLVDKFHSMKGRIGHGETGYGYCVTSNLTYNSKDQGIGKPYGYHTTAKIGSIYGCGWDQKTGIVFFYSGDHCLGTAFTGVYGSFYPAIGLEGNGIEVRVNLGANKFEWDAFKWWSPYHDLEKQIEDCKERKLCTYNISREDHIPQIMIHCYTCNLQENFGVCSICAAICHAGHSLGAPRMAPFFYCDCGHLTATKRHNFCKCLSPSLKI